MATLRELLQDVVNKSFNERVNCARVCYNDAMDIIRKRVKLAKSVSPTDFMYMLVGTCTCIDGTVSVGEKQMALALGLDPDLIVQYAQAAYNANFVDTLDVMVDDLSQDDKTVLVLLCIYIMGADDTFTVSEQNVICKLLA